MRNVSVTAQVFVDEILTISFKVVEVAGLARLLVFLDLLVLLVMRFIRSACQVPPLDQSAVLFQAALVHLQAQQDLGATLQRPTPLPVQLQRHLGIRKQIPSAFYSLVLTLREF
jgi:hypothetical protein